MKIQLVHTQTGIPLLGMLLVAGAQLRSSDHYDSTSGKWEPCPTPGVVLSENASAIWVRPNELTDDERRLLMALSSQCKGRFDCIAKVPRHAKGFVLIPTPDYNWDRRIENPLIEGEHIQSLLDVGYLERRQNDKNPDDETEFFVLTSLGWDAALALRN